MKHRLDPGLARCERACVFNSMAIEKYLTRAALFDACDLAHKCGFSGPIVAHDGDMLTRRQREIRHFQRVQLALKVTAAACVSMRSAIGRQNVLQPKLLTNFSVNIDSTQCAVRQVFK